MPPVDLPRGGARPAPPRVAVQAPTLPPIILARAPAPTRQQTQAAAYRAAPPRYTKPAYVPPSSVGFKPAAPAFHNAGPTGDYGTKAANAFKQTDAYKQSVIDVFLHQNPFQQQAIVSGALHNTASPEGQTVLDYLTNQLVPPGSVPHGPGLLTMREPGVPQPASAYPNTASIDEFRAQSPAAQKSLVQDALKNPNLPANKTLLQYVRRQTSGPAGETSPLTAAIQAPTLGAVGSELGGVPSGAFKIAQNFAKDIVNYAPQTLQGIWSGLNEEGQAIKGATTGDWPSALKHTETTLHQQFDPFVQAAEHPIRTAEAHPFNTLMMALGAKAALFKGAGAAMRSGALGGTAEALASTKRAPLSYGTVSESPTGTPLAEERSYSKDILNKYVQTRREWYIRHVLGQDPNVARPAPRLMPPSLQDVFNVGQEAKLRRVGNEMASTQQTLQRAERGRMVNEAMQARPKLKAAQNVVTHILQNIVRPNTAAEPGRAAADLASEAERLKSARTEARSQTNLWNKQQVRDIQTVLKTPGALEQALASAERLRPVINGQDTILEHHAILTPEQLTAKYFPYAQKHMGALYDHATGQLIEPVPAAPGFQHSYDPTAAGINRKTFFHGTNVKDLAVENLDASGTNEANLFGQGVYLTDNPEVAKGYAEARARRGGEPTIYRAKVKIRNPLDMEAPINSKFAEVLATRMENLAGMGDTEAAAALRRVAQKPGMTNEALYKEFVNSVRDFAAHEQIPRSEFVEDFQIIASELRREGFDALTHVGGKRVGGHGLHQTLILLDPSNTGALTGAGRQAIEFGPHVPPAAGSVPLYRPLSTDKIRAHLEANGVPDPAYVGHYANKATPRQFYMRYVKSRGTLSQGIRTGEAFRRGGYDHTYEGLTGQMAARAQSVAKAGIHDRLVQRSYLKPKDVVANQVKQEWAKARAQIKANPDQRVAIEAATRKETASIRTGMYTPAEAQAVIHAQPRDDFGNLHPSEVEMEPVAASSQKMIEGVRSLQNPMQLQSVSDLEARALQRAIDEAKGRTDGVRNVVLAPKVLTDQLTEQFKPGGRVERGFGRWTQQFRNTVLPYSTHWMAQIGTEAVVRSLLAGIFSPHYIADSKALYDRLGQTDGGRAAAAEMTGATFYGQHGAMGIYHSPNPLLRAMQDTRGTSDLIAAHKWWVNRVGKWMYSFEHNARMAGLGKLMHDHAAEMRQFGKGWQGSLRLQGEIIDKIAHDLTVNPALVAKFGRSIDNLFGQYGKYSPRTRAIIQSVAPFMPWYMTAAKYVFWQLPVHHRIASALLASLRQTVNQDIADGKKQPLNAFATQALGTLGPFGIFTPDSSKPADVAKELVQKGVSLGLPQLQGPLLALGGDNPFFGRLQGPHGTVAGMSPQAIATAAESLVEAGLPLTTKLREALEGGRPSYGTSNLLSPQPKPNSGPGDLSQILNRTANPFYSLQRALKAKPRSGGSAGSSTSNNYGLGTYGSGGSSGGGNYGLSTFH